MVKGIASYKNESDRKDKDRQSCTNLYNWISYLFCVLFLFFISKCVKLSNWKKKFKLD